MAIKVGINGFGRISTTALRESLNRPDIDIVGINMRNNDYDYMAYMLKYDSTFGRFPATVESYDQGLVINGKKIRVFGEEDASLIPWSEVGAEYIIEGTGAYLTTEKASAHLKGGAKKVIISAPAKDKDTPTFVYGVNHKTYTKDMTVVSGASCTTNCMAPMMKVIEDNFGIKEGLMATIHSVTSKQKVVDARSMKDWRVGRSIFNNIIPTSTGAAKAVGLVIPSLKGKLTGISYRIPAIDVSLVDVNVVTEKPTSYEEICAKMKEAAAGELKGVLEYCDEEVVSGDFKGYPVTSIFDAKQGIELNDHFFKIVGYYDNEYGYTSNLLNMLQYMGEVDHK